MAISIESINEQFITQGSTYDLVVDITGDPDTVKVFGAVEGFYQDWDAANDQLHIKSSDASRLINGQEWRIEAVKSSETVTAKIVWNVIKAAAIIQTLPTLHLYKGVPLNFDIIIYNIPPIVLSESLLVGVKSDLLEYGLNFKGTLPADADLTVTTENIKLVLPATPGHAETTKKYPFRIEDGSPGQIASPQFTPNGRYGELEFTDVTHALSYDWRLGDADWNTFDSTRQIINPGEVEITPGNLNVTVKFPNISGASSYEYRLDTENSEGSWVRFTGTLANGFITTIISNLEEGVAYILWLRVGSPWVGTPISITIIGGRLCYTLEVNASDRDNQWLYIFSTGFADGATITRTKRFLLPTSLADPEEGGLAVNGDGDVFILNLDQGVGTEKALYVFEASTINSAADGSRLTQDRKHPLPAAAPDSSGRLLGRFLAEYNNELYMYFGTSLGATGWATRLHAFAIPQTDGVVLSSSRSSQVSLSVNQYGFSVDKDHIWYKNSSTTLARSDRQLAFTQNPMIATLLRLYSRDGVTSQSIRNGLKVIGEDFYMIDDVGDDFYIYKQDPEVHATRHVLKRMLSLPSGLTRPRYLDIPT